MHYSVPYEYIKHKVDVRVTRNIVEVFIKTIVSAPVPGFMGAPVNTVTLRPICRKSTNTIYSGMQSDLSPGLKKLVPIQKQQEGSYLLPISNYSARRKLDKSQINRLATGEYIADKHNIIIMGASGAGKSYLACAFGMEACKQYCTVKYVRLTELTTDLAVARGEGVFKKVLSQYRKVNLLILDEWMLVSLTETEARDLLEIIHARHKKASTIFCSQFSPAGWYAKIGEATLADAI
jgi:hypothetical protein